MLKKIKMMLIVLILVIGSETYRPIKARRLTYIYRRNIAIVIIIVVWSVTPGVLFFTTGSLFFKSFFFHFFFVCAYCETGLFIFQRMNKIVRLRKKQSI